MALSELENDNEVSDRVDPQVSRLDEQPAISHVLDTPCSKTAGDQFTPVPSSAASERGVSVVNRSPKTKPLLESKPGSCCLRVAWALRQVRKLPSTVQNTPELCFAKYKR